MEDTTGLSSYEFLVEKMLEQAKKRQDPELFAVLKGAVHQHNTLLKIVKSGSSLTAYHPTTASMAITEVNELATKILEELKRRKENEHTDEETEAPTSGEHDTLG